MAGSGSRPTTGRNKLAGLFRRPVPAYTGPAMKRSITLLLSCGICAVPVLGAQNDERASGQHKAVLSGYQEVPSTYTTGSGAATVQADETGKSLTVTLRYSNLKGVAKAAHLHLGQPGVNGGIVASLCGADGKPACPAQATDFVVTVNAADVKAVQGLEAGALDGVLDALEHGALYVNIHTDKFADGEIRGQLRRGNGAGAGRDDEEEDEEDDEEKDKGKGKDKDKNK